MKRIIFFLGFASFFSDLFSCPFNFSPEDQRPFFEQYDGENDANSQSKKEEQ